MAPRADGVPPGPGPGKGLPCPCAHREEFLDELERALHGYRLGRPEDIARGVFQVLTHRISKGEIEDVLQGLPREIREVFSGA